MSNATLIAPTGTTSDVLAIDHNIDTTNKDKDFGIDEFLDLILAEPLAQISDFQVARVDDSTEKIARVSEVKAKIEGLLQFEHSVAGEPFVVDMEEDHLTIFHPTWSLIGVGNSLIEAEHNLIEEARLVSRVFLSIPLNELDPEAFRLYEFLLRITD